VQIYAHCDSVDDDDYDDIDGGFAVLDVGKCELHAGSTLKIIKRKRKMKNGLET
jgi:hypothetical protein